MLRRLELLHHDSVSIILDVAYLCDSFGRQHKRLKYVLKASKRKVGSLTGVSKMSFRYLRRIKDIAQESLSSVMKMMIGCVSVRPGTDS